MEKEPRKATDVLLDLESKVDLLLSLIQSQDLNIKLLSNKLNSVIEKLDKPINSNQKITVEAVSYENNFSNENIDLSSDESFNSDTKNIPVSTDFNLPVDSSPQGFRRTSRPETYSGDNMYLNKEDNSKIFPLQIPKIPDTPEIKLESNLKDKPSKAESKKVNKPTIQSNNEIAINVPVLQRVVDKNGKSIFLADVEIMNSSGESVVKTRTNGTGKWMASLPIGEYKVFIRKRESVTKEKMESIQSITVNGTQSPLELSMIIMK